MEEYHIISVNDTMIKAFRDGRIFTLCKKSNQYGKKGEWVERSVKPGKEGYIQICISGKFYYAHRLIMMAFVGDSDQEVDHINRIKTDNRFENLHYCTRSENNWNKECIDNAKGYNYHRNKWQARISINGKVKYLGLFNTEEEARQVYLNAKDKRTNDS
tara:strand:+ start:49 stop:525 length:477 start_codon:yes stop_codon:yes gene_type:complete